MRGGTGTVRLLVSATNYELDSATITVKRPLTLPDPSNRTFTEDKAVTAFTLPAASGGTTPYSYTATNLPSGLSFNSSNRRVSGTPTTPGSRTVTYSVEDAADDTVSQTFTITVRPGIELPDPSNRTFTEDEAVTAFTLPAASGGTPPYSYTVSNLPSGLSFNSSNRRVSGTPTTPGSRTVTYRVTDAARETASQTFTITVKRPLTLPDPSDRTFPEDEAVTAFTLPSASGGTTPYSYTATNLPFGVVVQLVE